MAHPGLDVPFEAFARRLLDSANGSTGDAALQIDAIDAEDFYLASACECGCPGSWERLEELYLPRLRTMALRWGASAAEADEVTRDLPGELLGQPAHGRTATRIGSYDGTGSLIGWLGRVVDRSLGRRAKRRTPAVPPAELEGKAADSDARPPDAVVYTETGERVGAAFETALLDLSAREFLLVTAKYRDGRSQKEIAHQLDISEPRVSYLLKRAVDRIRTSVWREIPDESAPQWLDRDGLAGQLREVIGRLLDRTSRDST
jgi:RNA polymerase sigma factor (sigma-70 family)